MSEVRNQKFCVLTTGRAGSTQLMDAIAALPGVAVPSKDCECRDHELINPTRTIQTVSAYIALLGRPIRTQQELVDGFFEYNAGYRFSGFKSMPHRHKNFARLTADLELKLFVLTRNDIISTIASFRLASQQGNWRRFGGAQPLNWRFRASDRPQVLRLLAQMHNDLIAFRQLSNPTWLKYEDLCDPAYRNLELDTYFGQPIRLQSPKPPTNARDYVTNWEEFAEYVSSTWSKFQALGTRVQMHSSTAAGLRAATTRIK